jgi:Spy/CpxP family protein refolding chaperone
MKKIALPILMLLAGAPAFAQTQAAPATSTTDSRAQQRQQFVDQEIAQLTTKLGLSADGANQLKQTFAKYQGQLQPLRQSTWQTAKALKQELTAAKPDSSKLGQLSDQLIANRQQMQSIEQQRTAELKSQLTPQQFAQLLVSRHQMGREMHHHQRGAHQGNQAPQQ